MLVLTRRAGEAITLSPSKDIDPNMTVGEFFASGTITIEVLEIGGQVKLGIEAPRALKVLRDELASAD